MTTPPADGMPSTRGTNFYLADPNLEFVCAGVMAPVDFARARPHLLAMGEVAGGELDALAAVADRHPPTLRTHDERGRRVDEVVRHPAYEAMERIAFERFGLAALSHREGVLGWPGRAPHVVKYALSYLFSQAEFGLLCPVSVTDSTSRVLRRFGDDHVKAAYLPLLTATDLDTLWQGAQWMTEKTGGSDVGASTTVARRDADGTWRLWGDKWFCSVANAGAALTLARPEGAPAGTRGLGLFLVPRVLPDGTRNAWTLNRLKDKLGSRSMATGETTLTGAVGYPVGDLGRGFAQMMEMVNVSRLSNAMRAAGIMRRSVLESVVHARGRSAFGRALGRAAPAPARSAGDAARRRGRLLGDPQRRRHARPRRCRLRRRPGPGPDRHAAGEVLADRARPRGGRRRDERARGQRLHRGVGERPAGARRPPRRHLGGLDQRGGARRPARDPARRRCRGAGRLRPGPARHGRRAARQALGGRGGRHARRPPAARGRLARPGRDGARARRAPRGRRALPCAGRRAAARGGRDPVAAARKRAQAGRRGALFEKMAAPAGPARLDLHGARVRPPARAHRLDAGRRRRARRVRAGGLPTSRRRAGNFAACARSNGA